MADNVTPHTVTIQLAVVPDDADNPDPASVSNTASNITTAFNTAGYTTTPLPTGTKGDFLYLLDQAGQWAWEQRDFLVSLASLLTSIISICQNAKTEREPDKPLTQIVCKTGDTVITIPTDRPISVEHLGDSLQPILHRPASPAVTIMVTHRVPGRPRRRR